MSIISLDKEYVAGTYGRFPLELVSGKGSILTDAGGKEYIDMGSGIGVTAFGFGDEEWIAATSAQLATLQHTSNPNGPLDDRWKNMLKKAGTQLYLA